MRFIDGRPGATASGRRAVGWAAAGLGAAGLVIGLAVAPVDAIQGEVYRLIYLHVPAAWTAYLSFFAVLLAGLAYLVSGDERWDRVGQAAAEVGLGLTALTIAVGMVWGRATWGVWWAWDPRLVSTALLLLCYAGCLAARKAGAPPRRLAWWGIAGFALVPVVHFSVVWWRSLHQEATVLQPTSRPPIHPLMLIALLICLGAATLGAVWLWMSRLMHLEREAAGRPAREASTSGVPVRSGANE
jgi:heme exporter protein C